MIDFDTFAIILAVLALATVIAGEAPGCSFDAKIAVAHVYQNRLSEGIAGGWFGHRQPAQEDLLAAITFWQYPDPTSGAMYMIGPGDGEKMPWLQKRTGRWECTGTWLESWR